MERVIADPEIKVGTGSDRGDGAFVAAARGIEAKSHEAIEKLAQAKDQIATKIAHAKDQIATKSLGEMVDDGRNVIRENPVNAILVSAGIGALIGFALGRRRS